ncbi:MAG: leucyl/phenylalanyl-tRNA--protein transferase, partial [Desulfosarcinaceae bacterium]
LSDKLAFPPPHLATREGLLAVGGDLSPERLILAYKNGIFPWYNPGEPILWWSPDPRLVLFPRELHVSHSLRRLLRKKKFQVTFNTRFREVIGACAKAKRRAGEGTWITPEMQSAYIRLNDLGYAHSVEAWQDGRLVGGLYGLALGRFFFGESMFTKVSNASKVAFVTLVKRLTALEFNLIDCQVYTQHLVSLGAREIPRKEFLKRIQEGL